MKAQHNIDLSGKRYLFIILIAFILISAFSGCSLIDENSQIGGFLSSLQGTKATTQETAVTVDSTVQTTSESSNAADPTPADPEITPEAATETPEPTPVSYTIELWVPPQFDIEQNTPGGKALQEAINAYHELHPNVDITLRVKATSGTSSMLNTITAANNVAKDVLPSLALLPRSDMETAVQRGLLEPIDSSVFSDSNSWYSYAKQSAVIDNTIYGIPILGDGLVLTYRIARVGAELSDWKDILTRGLPIGFAPSSSASMFGTFIYLSNGGKITNDQGALYLDQQKLTDTLNFFLTGGQNGAFPPSIAQLVDQAQVWQRFNDGTMSIIVSPFSSYRHYQAEGISALALPLPEGTTDYPLVNTWNLVLLAKDENLSKEAITFAEYLTDVTVNDKITCEAGYLPVRNSEHESWQNDPQFEIIKTMCSSAVLTPNMTSINKIVPTINNAVLQIIRTQQTPETAAQEAIATLN